MRAQLLPAPALPDIDLPLAHEAMDVLRINQTVGWSADEARRALTRRAYARPRSTEVEIAPNTEDAKYDRLLDDRLRCSRVQQQAISRAQSEKIVRHSHCRALALSGCTVSGQAVAYPEYELSVSQTFALPLTRSSCRVSRAKSAVSSSSRPLAGPELERLRYFAWQKARAGRRMQ